MASSEVKALRPTLVYFQDRSSCILVNCVTGHQVSPKGIGTLLEDGIEEYGGHESSSELGVFLAQQKDSRRNVLRWGL